MQILKFFPLVLSGFISGIIVYQSILIAPSINKLLSSEDASLYLRYIWPKFFIIIGILSLLCFISISLFNSNQSSAKIFSILSAVLMLVCYLAIPYMNQAKDSLNESLFMILHLGSIILTIITLLMNFFIFIFWKY
tara:strand:- start:3849 stop:4256 length:408 start_codon:yes stop_codon:yes gene_type:complete